MRRRVLQKILGLLTKGIIKRYNPEVIAVTGSVGKTSTKNAIALFFESHSTLWAGAGNLNTEFGAPLVFIGAKEGGGDSLFRWMKIIFSGIWLIIKKRGDYPKTIVVEFGADKPGDLSYLTNLVSPTIGVITMIGETPSHLQNYESIDELVQEKAKLAKKVKKGGTVILNIDDAHTREIIKEAKEKVISFGFNEEADVVIADFAIVTKRDCAPFGSSFKISYGDKEWRFHLPHCYGKPSAYSVAAAFACGIASGRALSRSADIFRELMPEKSRMQLIQGEDFFVMDDSYNSSPLSLESALETIKSIPAKRRIAVLGDMKELGSGSVLAHRRVGELVAKSCDFLITIGELANEIGEGALISGMNRLDINSFKTEKEVIKRVKSIVESGDLILVKGSRGMKMERIINKIV